MEFLRIQKALSILVGDSITDSRFYQTEGQFEQILRDESLDDREKAKQIAEILEEGIREQSNQANAEV